MSIYIYMQILNEKQNTIVHLFYITVYIYFFILQNITFAILNKLGSLYNMHYVWWMQGVITTNVLHC